MIIGKVICLSFAAAACCMGALSCTNISFSRPGPAAIPASPRAPVYVSDFVFSPGAFTDEAGLLPIHPVAPGPFQGVVPRVFGVPQDSSMRAHELVNLMSASIREGLADAGFDARRIAAEQTRPANGWLVRGTFTDMEEGNRLKRALIGLGAGKTHFQVFVFVDQLAPGPAPHTIALNTSAASGRRPGAIFSLDPVVAAATFVSCGLDLDHSVAQTGSALARQIARHIREHRAGGPPPHAQASARSP